jgi:radical SAM protein with 4Fe4S-binding SPASM domain
LKYNIHDKTYNYIYAFDSESGAYLRTGVLDGRGRDTGVDPFMGAFPHLIDIGVMGHCEHGKSGLCNSAGIGCYQSGLTIDKPNMRVDDFRSIAEECNGRTNQFALGGRGDPDQHEHFEQLLQICRENNIVPNFTTSGYGFTAEHAKICKKYCGAVAVSWYRNDYTLRAIDALLTAGVKTNIHYVLGNNSIDEAITRLENDDFPSGINAVVFLMHKPAGLGRSANVLKFADPRVKRFFELLDAEHSFKCGIDSCGMPGAVNFCKNVLYEALDTCEGGRFSCYIGADMVMLPCSFDQKGGYAVDLSDRTIEDAWNSAEFERFRENLRTACPDCGNRELCMGGCPLMPEIVLCGEKN